MISIAYFILKCRHVLWLLSLNSVWNFSNFPFKNCIRLPPPFTHCTIYPPTPVVLVPGVFYRFEWFHERPGWNYGVPDNIWLHPNLSKQMSSSLQDHSFVEHKRFFNIVIHFHIFTTSKTWFHHLFLRYYCSCIHLLDIAIFKVCLLPSQSSSGWIPAPSSVDFDAHFCHTRSGSFMRRPGIPPSEIISKPAWSRHRTFFICRYLHPLAWYGGRRSCFW